MEYIQESGSLEDYLIDSKYVDFRDDGIQEQARRLFEGCAGPHQKIRAAFEFVRDEIAHSCDIGNERVTRTASEALRYREGICYAKSMLLAALLRSAGIPTGFCYQRLTLGDTPDTGLCIHALNAVWLADRGLWVRIDARGNTNEKNAQFDPDDPEKEQLAFPIRPEYGELEYPTVYAQPLPATTAPLESCGSCSDMVSHHLPQTL